MNRAILGTVSVVVSVTAGLGLAEEGLRLLGRRPFEPPPLRNTVETQIRQPDPDLGWTNRPGVYPLPDGGRITILPDGSRGTGVQAASEGPEIRLIGCSFIFGHALADRDTLAALLQQDHPQWVVRNDGVSGYGTLQSLLLLERRLAAGARPAIVVYGFIAHHEVRNVGRSGWILYLTSVSTQRMSVRLPYAEIAADGSLRLHAPVAYPVWPLADYSAATALAQTFLAEQADAQRRAQQEAVTHALIRELHSACEQAGALLVVALLTEGKQTRIDEFLQSEGIPYADCRFPIRPENRVPGDGHPNRAHQELWRPCLEPVLEPLVEGTGR